MYTLLLNNRHSFGAQIAAVNLDGTLRLDESNLVRYSNITSGSNTYAGSTGYFRDRITDRLWMPGFTGKVDYRLSFDTVVFRIGVFYQEMKMQSRNARDDGISIISTDATPGLAATLVPLPATPTRLQPNFSVNGAKDIFKGISFSAAVKVF